MICVVPFSQLDTASISRSLAQIQERQNDVVDLFVERIEDLGYPAEGESPGVSLRREEGFSMRLIRDGRVWMGVRDELSREAFSQVLRETARVQPRALYSEPQVESSPWEEVSDLKEVAEFPLVVERILRDRHIAFPYRLRVRRRRRWIQVIGTRLVPAPEQELFYSFDAVTPWGRNGAVFARCDDQAAEGAASSLRGMMESREAESPEAGALDIVLGPNAAAVLLHEAVAHALEADTLALSGRPEAAIGQVIANPCLSVLDDPGRAPEGVRRRSDDEGMPVTRRWLLQGGKVGEPLADLRWALGSDELTPGAGRRETRVYTPGPRSTHLEVMPGDSAESDLLSAGTLYFSEASRGSLDPISGRFSLEFPFCRRVENGELGRVLGASRLWGTVADVLGRVVAVGNNSQPAGAGWCAKGGQRLPVWATTPSIRLEGVGIEPCRR